MADERKPSIMRRPKFLLFCLYMAGYVYLRFQGEIVHMNTERREGGKATPEVVVGGAHTAPRWRRQLYRVVFSPLMVAEEEMRLLYHNSGDLARGGVDFARQYLPF